jgi:hypothetical protein
MVLYCFMHECSSYLLIILLSVSSVPVAHSGAGHRRQSAGLHSEDNLLHGGQCSQNGHAGMTHPPLVFFDKFTLCFHVMLTTTGSLVR